MIHSTISAPKGEKTKYRLAESMKECMKTTPVEEITVRQICEICGVTRQTFYRNFLDKYDLINWYFDKIIYHFFLIFLYLIKCPQSLILSALRAFLLSVHVRISGYIFLCFPSQTW